MSSREPIFNIPRPVLVLLLMLVAIHGLRELLADDHNRDLTLALAFIPARYTGTSGLLPGGTLAAWTSWVTHMFVHGDWTHLGINSAWLLAMGSGISRRIGTPRFLAYSLVCGIAGAALFAVVNWGQLSPVVGASGALSGLMAGVLRLLPGRESARGGERAGPATSRVASLADVFRDRQFRLVVAVWLAINVGLGFTGDLLTPGMAGIAWEAHVGGFLAGLLLLGAFMPATDPTDEGA